MRQQNHILVEKNDAIRVAKTDCDNVALDPRRSPISEEPIDGTPATLSHFCWRACAWHEELVIEIKRCIEELSQA